MQQCPWVGTHQGHAEPAIQLASGFVLRTNSPQVASQLCKALYPAPTHEDPGPAEFQTFGICICIPLATRATDPSITPKVHYLNVTVRSMTFGLPMPALYVHCPLYHRPCSVFTCGPRQACKQNSNRIWYPRVCCDRCQPPPPPQLPVNYDDLIDPRHEVGVLVLYQHNSSSEIDVQHSDALALVSFYLVLHWWGTCAL